MEYVPKPVMDAAAASGASGCQSYQYELKNEKYEFDDCDGGIDYEVDANNLSVVVEYDDDTHPGADAEDAAGDFVGAVGGPLADMLIDIMEGKNLQGDPAQLFQQSPAGFDAFASNFPR